MIFYFLKCGGSLNVRFSVLLALFQYWLILSCYGFHAKLWMPGTCIWFFIISFSFGLCFYIWIKKEREDSFCQSIRYYRGMHFPTKYYFQDSALVIRLSSKDFHFTLFCQFFPPVSYSTIVHMRFPLKVVEGSIVVEPNCSCFMLTFQSYTGRFWDVTQNNSWKNTFNINYTH